MAVNVVLTTIPGNTDGGTVGTANQAHINENIATGTKIAEIVGFDTTDLPPSGSYNIVAIEDVGERYTVIKEGAKYYLIARNGGATNFDYEDDNYAGIHEGITFQFFDSADTTA